MLARNLINPITRTAGKQFNKKMLMSSRNYTIDRSFLNNNNFLKKRSINKMANFYLDTIYVPVSIGILGGGLFGFMISSTNHHPGPIKYFAKTIGSSCIGATIGGITGALYPIIIPGSIIYTLLD